MSDERKTAVVTGAAKGIGKSIAERLAADGCNVVINYRSEERRALAEETAERCRNFGIKAEIFRADVSNEDECRQMIEFAARVFSHIDILVNNAGVVQYGLLTRLKNEDYHNVIACNQDSVFFMIKNAAKIMKKQQSGRIINITSMAGVNGTAGGIAYSASKGAVIAMTKAAAKELSCKNITVNAVAPGMVETEMTDVVSYEDAVRRIGLGRYAKPEEIAGAVSYLASDEAAYVTGAVIEIHGSMVS